MEYMVPAPDLEPGHLRVIMGAFGNPRLLLDATRLKVRGKKPTALPAPHGHIAVTFPRGPGRFVMDGQVVVNGQTLQVAPKISLLLYGVLLGSMVVLIVSLGAVGALLGIGILAGGQTMLRSGMSSVAKVWSTIALATVAVTISILVFVLNIKLIA